MSKWTCRGCGRNMEEHRAGIRFREDGEGVHDWLCVACATREGGKWY